MATIANEQYIRLSLRRLVDGLRGQANANSSSTVRRLNEFVAAEIEFALDHERTIFDVILSVNQIVKYCQEQAIRASRLAFLRGVDEYTYEEIRAQQFGGMARMIERCLNAA